MLVDIANLYLTEDINVYTVLRNIGTIILLNILHALIWIVVCLLGVSMLYFNEGGPIMEIRVLAFTVISLVTYILTQNFRVEKRKLERKTCTDATRIYDKSRDIAKKYSSSC